MLVLNVLRDCKKYMYECRDGGTNKYDQFQFRNIWGQTTRIFNYNKQINIIMVCVRHVQW
jgi:hypothetical protein